MDKRYITLFKDLAQATAATAEAVMEYDRKENDQTGLETATTMRNDHQALADSINTLGENYQLNKGDAAKLLVSVMVQVNQLQNKIQGLQKAITGFQTEIIPQLKKIVDNAKDDEEAIKMANEKFIIKNEE